MERTSESSPYEDVTHDLLELREKTKDSVFLYLSLIIQSKKEATSSLELGHRGVELKVKQGEKFESVLEKIREFIKQVKIQFAEEAIKAEVEKRVRARMEVLKNDLRAEMEKRLQKILAEKEAEYQARVEALEHEVAKETKTPKAPIDASYTTDPPDPFKNAEPFAGPPSPRSSPTEPPGFLGDADPFSDSQSDPFASLSERARSKRGSRRGESSRLKPTPFGPGEGLYPDLRGRREAFGELYERFRTLVSDLESSKKPLPEPFPNIFYEEKFNAGGALEYYYHPEKALQQVLDYLRTQEWGENKTNAMLLNDLEKDLKEIKTELEFLDIGIAFFKKILSQHS